MNWIRKCSVWKKVALVLLLIPVMFVLVVQAYVYRPVSAAAVTTPDKLVAYFAYGSNMSSRYLSNVRHTHVHESLFATIDDHAVRFNVVGLPFIEPHFASLISAPGQRAAGIVHFIAREDLNRILSSEGEVYQLVNLEVSTVKGKVQAFTLVADLPDKNGIVSSRYHSLMLEGFNQVKAPDEYINQLQNQPTTYTPILSELIGSGIMGMVILTSID